MEDEEYPTTVSVNAGKYLCNYMFYNVMYFAEFESHEALVAGFIHVPPADEGSIFSVTDITRAHRAGLTALASWIDSGRPSDSPPRPWVITPPIYTR